MLRSINSLKTSIDNSKDFDQINYGRHLGDGASVADKQNNRRPSRTELIKALNHWQSQNLLKERERFPEHKIRNSRKCYTEYFVAKSTGEEKTVAELVAENVSKSIVLLAFIATKPEVRCSGIGSELMKFFRRVVEEENPNATIFLEVDDPDVAHINDEERQIRKRRINWYLRQGAVMWSGYYEMPNALDKRMRGNKAIFMALPRPFEKISFQQLQEAALEILQTAYGLSVSHWLYKKVARQCEPVACAEVGELDVDEYHKEPTVANHEQLRTEAISQTLSFLKAQLRDSTKYGVLSPEEAIRRYLELERARKIESFESATESWNVSNISRFSDERQLERVNERTR